MEDNPFMNWEKDRAVEGAMSTAQALAVLCKDDRRARISIKNYVRFLLSEKEDRDYRDLAQFLQWYGETYVLGDVFDFITQKTIDVRYPTAIEFGPGTGWLIGGVAHLFKNAYAVDKRAGLHYPYPNVTFVQRDLEKEPGFLGLETQSIQSVIIANHFLHCVDDPVEVIKKSPAGAWLVIEPTFSDTVFPFWGRQMADFGATPHRWGELIKYFAEAGYTFVGAKMLRGQQIGLFEKV